jgi:hypothetical protein
MQSLSSLGAEQAKTEERLYGLLNIFGMTGLSNTREGKKALAEETLLILCQHHYERLKILRSNLNKEEAKQMIEKGREIVKREGYGKSLNIMDVVTERRKYLRAEQANSVAKLIAESPAYTDEEKKLARVVADDIRLATDWSMAKHALSNYKLTRAFHTYLRRNIEDKVVEKIRIWEALVEFRRKDAKIAPQWYESAPRQFRSALESGSLQTPSSSSG